MTSLEGLFSGIVIDGSLGEGGGQMLRQGMALSMMFGITLKFVNIRQGRPKPGLSAQHLEVVKTFQRLGAIVLVAYSDDHSAEEPAEVQVGTTGFTFIPPGELQIPEQMEVNIGTAGSLTLLLQALLPVIVSAQKSIEITLIGGTDVSFSPPFDYFREVLLSYISRMGIGVEVRIESRGFYPRGGGRVVIIVNPVSEIRGLHIEPNDGLREIMTSITTKGEIEGLEEVIETAGSFSSQVKRSHTPFYNKKDRKRKTICVQITGHPRSETGNMVSHNFLSDQIEPVKSWVEEMSRSVLIDSGLVDEHSADQLIIFCVMALKFHGQISTFKCVKEMSSQHFETVIEIVHQVLPDVLIKKTEQEDGLEISVEYRPV